MKTNASTPQPSSSTGRSQATSNGVQATLKGMTTELIKQAAQKGATFAKKKGLTNDEDSYKMYLEEDLHAAVRLCGKRQPFKNN